VGEWFEDAFRADYLRVYPHRDDAQAADDVTYLLGLLPGLAPERRVLDLACGAGRHLRAMEAAGARPFGADLSPSLLAEARRLGSRHVVRCDMRRLPFRDGTFDAVTLFFNSFGYFETDEEDARALCEAARVLCPGGGFVLDLVDPAALSRSLVPRSERSEGASSVVEERSLAEDGRRVRKSVTVREGATSRSWTESLRLYADEEVLEAAGGAGLRIRKRVAGPSRTGEPAARRLFLFERAGG